MRFREEALDSLPAGRVTPARGRLRVQRLCDGVELDVVESLKQTDDHERDFVVCELGNVRLLKLVRPSSQV